MIADSDLSREAVSAFEHCRRITRHAAKTFYWGSLLLPRRKRLATWALYAFCRTVDDCVDRQDNPDRAEAELDLWRNRLIRAYDGIASGPITQAWIASLAHYAIPLQPALDLIEGARMDLRFTQPATFDDLHLYCYRVAGTIGLLMSPILGYRSPDALPLAVDLGVAMQLTNILRDVGEDLHNGRVYLPRDEMQRFGYSEADLRAGIIDERFITLMRFQLDRAEGYYARARPGIDMLDKSAQLAILASAEMYRGIHAAIVANGYDVLTQRAYVPLSTKMLMLPKLWLAVKSGSLPVPGTAQNEMAHHVSST